MRYFLMLFFSWAFFQTNAQNSELSQTSKGQSNATTVSDSISQPYFIIPKLSILDPAYGVILIGFDKPIKARQSIEFAIGIIYDDFFNEDHYTGESISNPSYRELDNKKNNLALRLDYKFFLNKQKYTYSKWYIAPEIFYNIRNYKSMHHPCIDTASGWFFSTCKYAEEENRYTTIRKDYGGHAKVGFQKIFKSGFTIDMYSGIGLRYIKTSTTGKIEDLYHSKGFISLGSSEEEFDKINKLKFSMNIGFKIGFAIRK